MQLTLSSKRVGRLLTLSVTLLIVAHGCAMFSSYVLGHGNLLGLVPAFDLSEERNIPTLYSTLTLLACSVLLFLVGRTTPAPARNRPAHWYGLAAIFMFLAADEFMEIHEKVGEGIRTVHETEGLLYYAWIIPYALMLVVLGVAYGGFVRRLPSPTRNRFLLAGATYVTGAMGFEALGGNEVFERGSDTHTYLVFSTLEESFEMIGIAIFLVSLVAYLGKERAEIVVRFATTRSGS